MKKFFKTMRIAVTGVALGAAVFLGTKAGAQTAQINIPSPLSIGTNNAGTWTSTAGTPFPITPGVDYGFLFTTTGGAAGAAVTNSGNQWGFNFQIANQWTTTYPLVLTTTNAGSNTVSQYLFVSKTNFAGVNAIRLDEFTSSNTNQITPQSLYPGWTH